MKCDDVKPLLDEYREGSLPAGDAALVKEHIRKCADCREELEFLRKYLKKTGNFPALKAPDDFLEKIHQKIDAPVRGALVTRLFFPLKIKVPLEVAALLALAVSGLLVFKPFSTEMAEYKAEGPGRHLAMEDKTTASSDREAYRSEKPSAAIEKAPEKAAIPKEASKVESRAADMVASTPSYSEQLAMEKEQSSRGDQAEITLCLKQNITAGAEPAKEESFQARNQDRAGEPRTDARKSLGYAKKDKAAPEGAMQSVPTGTGQAQTGGIAALAQSLNGKIIRKTADGSQVIVEIPRGNFSRFMGELRGEWSVQRQYPAEVPARARRVRLNINIQK
ncbi:MAG TPA: zf-HC2 domain-containing protein [Spirochaetota bacterium]|nr:zf-HC2 domain-containing protein [Spirochaetota bacterium]